MRFCWHVPISLQQRPSEDDEKNEFGMDMLYFWNSILREDTPIYHSSSHQVKDWKDLKEAICGETRYMEPSNLVQGNFSYSTSDFDKML
jgi:hypothetical protein